MKNVIGIRREDKNEWERRVPIIPRHAREIIEKHGITVHVQTSENRIYTDGEYMDAGAIISEDVGPSKVVFAVKEIPAHLIEKGKTYVFFSHTIKGQKHNMPMLRKLMEQGCDLIDYELVTDEKGKRLIFFGWHAGVAGMIDTFWSLGHKLDSMGIENPFHEIRQAHHYRDLNAAKSDIKAVANLIKYNGLPQAVTPFVIGVAGYGNVSRGAQEILDMFPIIEIKPSELAALKNDPSPSRHHVYKVVFKEEDLVRPKDPSAAFELQDYYNHPEKFEGRFHEYLPDLTAVVNAIFWTEKYPRLITRESVEKLWNQGSKKLLVVGDVTCDVEGSVELNVRETTPGDPVYTYNPMTGETTNGFCKEGVTILAVDILPSELPKEASDYFSNVLVNYVPDLVKCDFSDDFKDLQIPDEIKRALIVHRGKLTPKYEYIGEFLRQ